MLPPPRLGSEQSLAMGFISSRSHVAASLCSSKDSLFCASFTICWSLKWEGGREEDATLFESSLSRVSVPHIANTTARCILYLANQSVNMKS